jgi:hypothetical protein
MGSTHHIHDKWPKACKEQEPGAPVRGEALGLNLGAPVRLWLAGGAVGAGLVRKEDWDSLSDWGQLVHALKLGSDTSPVGLWVGALEGYSLLSGHLVRRYSNRGNPDYHPAGASLTGTLGPLYVEAFASDVLGAPHGCPGRGGLAAPLHRPTTAAGPLHPGGCRRCMTGVGQAVLLLR